MEFVVKAWTNETVNFIEITPEIVANQRVGSRLELLVRHDLTVEFADGALMVDDIDLIIFIIPNEYFCYRNNEFVLKFVLGSRRVQLDHRPGTGINARLFITVQQEDFRHL